MPQVVETTENRCEGMEALDQNRVRPRQVRRRGGTAFRFRSMGPLLGPSGGPFWNPRARKLRRVNERVDGYEPGGRRFESCRARQPSLAQTSSRATAGKPSRSAPKFVLSISNEGGQGAPLELTAADFLCQTGCEQCVRDWRAAPLRPRRTAQNWAHRASRPHASSVDHLVKNQTLSVADTARTRCVARAGWLGIAIDSILTSIHRRSDTSWSRTARPGKIQTHSP
jgi:hypothetical protein